MNRTNDSNLLKDVISFIENMYGPCDGINENSKLEEDLTITGDEACDFLIGYGKAFNVDVSKFNVDRYFKPEGYGILTIMLENANLKKKHVSKDLTVGDLVKGIRAGKLDDEVINAVGSSEL